jgi:hypothetical protein
MERNLPEDTEGMTSESFDPSQAEQIFMSIIYKTMKDLDDPIHENKLSEIIKEKIGEEIEDKKISTVMYRLGQEGFISIDDIGLVKLLPCGDLDFDDDY